MSDKKPARHDDMRNPRNKQQYRTIDNRNALRSLTNVEQQQKTNDTSKKKEGENG